jgi:hypothetical protein
VITMQREFHVRFSSFVYTLYINNILYIVCTATFSLPLRHLQGVSTLCLIKLQNY